MISLRLARRHAGLTQAELAAKAGVSPHTVRAIERGQREQPHPRTMRRLARAVGVPIPEIEEFANGHAERSSPPAQG